MVKRALKVCSHAGCNALSVNGRCDKHPRHKTNWGEDRQRGTSSQRGYGSTWNKTRAFILGRDNHLCQVCIKSGIITPATEVDHIKPKSYGGDDSHSNLQAICKACHKVKTAKESN